MAKIYVKPHQIFLTTKSKCKLENIEANWPFVCDALEIFDINTPLVQAGMAATILLETGNFRPIKENLSKQPDSSLYKAQMRYWPSGYYGRGYIQLTWQRNYEAAGKALKIDLLANPDLALQPAIAAKIAAWFFRVNGVYYDCNASDWEGVRRKVNGPTYYKDKVGLERFLGYCNLLSGFAKLGDNYGQP